MVPGRTLRQGNPMTARRFTPPRPLNDGELQKIMADAMKGGRPAETSKPVRRTLSGKTEARAEAQSNVREALGADGFVVAVSWVSGGRLECRVVDHRFSVGDRAALIRLLSGGA